MIDARELRIGNWVKAGKMIDPIQVYSIDFNIKDRHLINGSTIPCSDLHPIPLSPEVLLAVGFELKKDDEYYTCYSLPNGWHICRPNNDISIQAGYKKGSWYWSAEILDVEIKTLHHLQNLYYAHTQKELEYKPVK